MIFCAAKDVASSGCVTYLVLSHIPFVACLRTSSGRSLLYAAERPVLILAPVISVFLRYTMHEQDKGTNI